MNENRAKRWASNRADVGGLFSGRVERPPLLRLRYTALTSGVLVLSMALR